jgi:hypothetical protein
MDVGTLSHDVSFAIAESRPARRFWPPRVIALIGTLLLHTLVLQSVLLGTRAHKVRPPEVQGPGATLIKSATVPAEALILIELPSTSLAPKALLDDLASAGSAPKNLLVTMINPDPLPLIEIPQAALGDNNDAVASVDSGDPAGRVRLFGIYSGQIEARIARAWRRPRSPVNPGSDPLRDSNSRAATGASKPDVAFQCRVRILQDVHGFVQEVQMLDCNGSVIWQQSLVAAILTASPLPAPPSPTVFTHALTMTFEGQAYAAGSIADEYELEQNPIVQVRNTVHAVRGESVFPPDGGASSRLKPPILDDNAAEPARPPTEEPSPSASDQ